MRLVDRTHHTYGRLFVIMRGPNTKNGQAQWWCECECGNEVLVASAHLHSGHTQSCGCLKKERLLKALTKHGHALSTGCSREYRSYCSAKRRCNNPESDDYSQYGGRGIKFCFESFEEFFEHMGPCPEGCTLDRIDNEGNYEAGNLRWATPKQQANNTRTNRYIAYNGRTLTITGWARELDIDRLTLKTRLDELGWPVEKAFSTPARKIQPRRFEHEGVIYTIRELSEMSGIESELIRKRLVNQGWPVERALEKGDHRRKQ